MKLVIEDGLYAQKLALCLMLLYSLIAELVSMMVNWRRIEWPLGVYVEVIVKIIPSLNDSSDIPAADFKCTRCSKVSVYASCLVNNPLLSKLDIKDRLFVTGVDNTHAMALLRSNSREISTVTTKMITAF